MKTFLSTIIVFLSLTTYSQQKKVSGNVWNSENNQPLAYVNIGIKNKTVGTVSNKKGLFELLLNDQVNLKDTVYFSYIGFNIEKYLISELQQLKKPILLQPKTTELDEVFISSQKIKLKPKKIGRTSKGLGMMHSNFYTSYEKDVDDRLSKESGMKFKMKRNCHIKDLNFNVTNNQFKSLKFRVNIYKIENGLPTDLIIQDNIIFEIKDGFLGWVKVDLEPYDIHLKKENEEVAVTIQWLESVKENKKSKYFSISTAASPLHTAYFRDKAMDNWDKGEQNLSFYLNAMCE